MEGSSTKYSPGQSTSPPSTPGLSDSASTSESSHPSECTHVFNSTPVAAPISAPGHRSASLERPAVVIPSSKSGSSGMHRSDSQGDRRRLSSVSSASSAGSTGNVAGQQQRPRLFHSNSLKSRPSSVASNSSTGGSSSAGGTKGHKIALSASLLSPSLATALGIHPDTGRRQSHHHIGFYASPHSASCTSLTGLVATASTPGLTHSHSSRGRKARGDSFGAVSARRPSLPSASTSTQNRVSMVSIASFDSLPEGETVPAFATSPRLRGSDGARRQSDALSSNDGGSHIYIGSPPKEETATDAAAVALMLPPPSLPTHSRGSISAATISPPVSPVASAMHVNHSHSHSHSHSSSSASDASSGRRRAMLKRAMTEPSGAGLTSYDEKMRKRGLIARELLTTERAFVESLQVLHDSFYQPLLSRCGGLKGSPNLSATDPPILSRKAVSDIFSNFVDILRLNTELLARLEDKIGATMQSEPSAASPQQSTGLMKRRGSHGQTIEATGGLIGAVNVTAFPSAEGPASQGPWDPEKDTVGDILVPIAPFLKMYSLYVKNFSSALARIESERRENEVFAKFLKDTERSTWGRGKAFYGLGLQAHLLTVVQRIPRYTLLVGDLLKHTPVGHRDHSDLARAFGMVEQVASSINENVRQHEMAMLILSLQRSLTGLNSPLVVPGRALIKRGTLHKACRKDVQPRAFFLFTDCIVYARPSGGGGSASIEAAWNAIARAGGISSAGLPGDIAGPWSPSSRPQRASLDHGVPQVPLEAMQSRTRVSSGNLFSSNAILDALQAAAAHQAPQALQFRDKFALQDCTVIGVEDSTAGHFLTSMQPQEAGVTPWSFEIRTPDKSFAVYAESAEARAAWVSAIREARNDWLQARRTLRAEEDSIEARRDRRRSVAAAAAAAKARQSVYSLSMAGNPSIPEGHEGEDQSNRESFPAMGSPNDGEMDTSFSPERPAEIPHRARSGPRTSLSLASMPTSTSFAALLSSTGNNAGTPGTPLRVLEDYNAPAWVPDSRADRCMACSETFGLWRRKHHCRLCGRVVCWSCSTRKFVIAGYEEGKEDIVARACDACYESTFPETPGAEDDGVAQAQNLEECEQGADETMISDHQPGVSSNDGPIAFPSVETSSADASVSSGPQHRAKDASGVVRFKTPSEEPQNDGKPFEQRESQDHQKSADVTESIRSRPEQTHSAAEGRSGTPLDTPLASLSLNDTRLEQRRKSQAPLVPFPKEADQPVRARKISRHDAGHLRTPGSAAQVMISNSASNSLMPTVQAATSGTGTFRLAPPQITTPEDEYPRLSGNRGWYGCNAAASTSHRSLIGQGDSYFAGATIPEGQEMTVDFPSSLDAAAASNMAAGSGVATPTGQHGQQLQPPRRRERVSSNASITGHDGDTQPHHRPSKRKPMSAAARLSTYYGQSLGLAYANGRQAKDRSHHEPAQTDTSVSPLRKASN